MPKATFFFLFLRKCTPHPHHKDSHLSPSLALIISLLSSHVNERDLGGKVHVNEWKMGESSKTGDSP